MGTGAQLAGAAVATAGVVMFAKRSGKEMSSDKPSWANKDMVDYNKSAQQNATEMLNNKYGQGKWQKIHKDEFSTIVKWITRKLFYNR